MYSPRECESTVLVDREEQGCALCPVPYLQSEKGTHRRMRIRNIKVRLCDVASLTARADAIQAFPKQETILVDIETEDGLVGTGYAYTIGTGGHAVFELLRDDLLGL